jgi:hypothetical protein
MRLMSMVGMLIVLGMLIGRAGDPRTWRWLAGDKTPTQDSPDALEAGMVHAKTIVGPKEKIVAADEPELIVAGPADNDAEEIDAAREEFQAVGDRVPLSPQEMPAYWRMMGWTRAQSFDQLQERARRDLLFTHFWERPAKYRGELTFLKLHIERVLTYDAPPNEAGLKQLYEAWGWTDDSKSFPYVVVFSELPAGMRLGAHVSEDATFTGYFMKLLPYQAFDVKRAAPLLVGRLRWQENPARAAIQPHDGSVFWLTLGGGGILLMLAIARWVVVRRSRSAVKTVSALDMPADRWLESVEQAAELGGTVQGPEESDWAPVDLHLSDDEPTPQDKGDHS